MNVRQTSALAGIKKLKTGMKQADAWAKYGKRTCLDLEDAGLVRVTRGQSKRIVAVEDK